MDAAAPEVLAVDTGGTFTDYLALFESGETASGKIPSTPDDPSQSIETLFEQFNVNKKTTFIHGTTVATNALLEDDLSEVLLVTNYGLEGMLEIGRGERQQLYELNPDPSIYPFQSVPVTGVHLRDHPMLDDPGFLSEREAARLRNEIRERDPEQVAICLVHSYRDDRQEVSVETALEPLDIPVVRSSDITPRFREFERASAAVLNVGLRPLITRYLRKISRIDPGAGSVRVMGSSRGTLSTNEASEIPVQTLLSGPAAGLLGARSLVEDEGETDLITMDTGGTSTDVSLIRSGQISLREDHRIGNYPVSEPMADIHTVGAGGGSILWVDEGGHLRVGPRSAGADPGPACYGKGGPPTVTDLQVVLGRIPTDRPLSSELQLDKSAAEAALQELADQLNQPVLEVARGGLEIMLTQLAEALRAVTVQRGVSPEELPLVAFGGGGGLYGGLLAERLHMDRVYVPRRAGVASARGLLDAPDCFQQMISPMSPIDPEGDDIPGSAELEKRAPDWADRADRVEFEAACQFRGQNHVLNVSFEPGQPPARLVDQFQDQYREQYGYTPAEDTVEVVHLSGFWFRTQAYWDSSNGHGHQTEPESSRERDVHTREGLRTIPEWPLETVDHPVTGPAVLVGSTTTAYLPEHWTMSPADSVVRFDHNG